MSVLAPSFVWQKLFECDKRLEWVNHSPVGDKWVMSHDRPTRPTHMTDPLKFKINNPLSRICHRKPTTRGACAHKISFLLVATIFIFFLNPSSSIRILGLVGLSNSYPDLRSRRPRCPGFRNSLFSSRESWFSSQTSPQRLKGRERR